jgi:hypothetical protein
MFSNTVRFGKIIRPCGTKARPLATRWWVSSLFRDVLLADFDETALEREDTHERFEQRGFAHAVAADDREDFLGRGLERHIVDDLALVVTGGEVGDLDHRNGLLWL